MKKSECKIHIVGAGLAGLVAAVVLEEHGFDPVIYEASENVGGRVKTDIVEGWQLDHGFQVLLTAYPAAQKYLDFDALELQSFLPGAAIFKDGTQKTIGDPLRNFNLLLPTLFANIGTLSDKINILKLNGDLKKKTIREIFETEEITTQKYLKTRGFSDVIITDFFTPFFAGIFLESELKTSSRMFEFIYKMFGEGLATLPKAGIGAIPNQLAEKLKRTKFHFNTTVKGVEKGTLKFADESTVQSDFTIIATDASRLVADVKNPDLKWKGVDTLYFEVPSRVINKPLIGLVPKKNALVNNVFYHTSLATHSSSKGELLSVSVVREHDLDLDGLVSEVTKELSDICDIKHATFLKRYNIAFALPDLSNVKYQMQPSETRLSEGVFLAGDTLLNGSLNAAMLSGECAAMGIIEAFGSDK